MLSIIIPTLNEEKYLPRLLKSIINQSFKDYEIIVADNNSKDKTKIIAKKFHCKIANGGLPGKARNNGAKIAKGELLLFIDADCRIRENFLKNALEEIKNRNLDIAGCKVFPSNGRIIDKLAFLIFNFWIYSTQKFYPNATAHGIFCKYELHKKIDGFDEKIKLSEDMNYCKLTGKKGKFGILKTTKVFVSTRRFDYYGRFNVFIKLFLSALYRLIFGEIKTNIFNYRFDYKK